MNVERHRRPRVSILLASAAALAAVNTAAPSAIEAASPFTLIVLPDTQNYTDFDDTNDRYNLGQMNWIRNNMTNLNIKFVMHVGDHQNPGNPYRTRTDNIYEPDLSKPLGDVNDKLAKWSRASAAIQVLDDHNIPYSLVPGNHDYRNASTKDEPYLYLKTFGPQRYVNEQNTWAPEKRTYVGASPSSPTFAWAGMSTYHRFDAGGYKFLNIALQYDPDDNDLAWAQKIINENPGLPTIVTTHAFVNTEAAANPYQHPGIFNKFVKNNPQIVMTFNGHLTGAESVVGENIAGLPVHQMLVDYQAVQLDAQLGGGDYYRGGGVLRRVEFNPDADRVSVRDYSPIANRFLPADFTAKTNDGDTRRFESAFEFDLDLDGRFGPPNQGGVVKSVSFRQGVNGYTGARDTWLDQNNPTATHGSDATAWIDGDRNGATAGTPESQGLIRFDFIFDAGNLPADAKVNSAELVIRTSDLPDSQSPNTITLYRLLKPWTVNGTWDSQTNGISADGIDAILAANDAIVPDVQGEFLSFDVTESLAAWLAGAENYGWALLPGGGNGWQWDTSDAVDILDRPVLNVAYRSVVPEPTGAAVTAAVVIGSLIGRRRNRRHAGSFNV